MFNPTITMTRNCIELLQVGYRQAYGSLHPEYAELIGQVAGLALEAIAHSDALYHNVEHTILVALVGQEILLGKHQLEGSVTCQDWANFIISLLCHDIGYIRGICYQDDATNHVYATGLAEEKVAIAPGATDASLTPYHVDRGKQFVQENLTEQSLLNLQAILQNIELTRFPVPKDALHQDTVNYPGLARAADLIGQLSDPRYLEKLPALFYEFEEVGSNQSLGYQHPADLRAGYPQFFRQIVLSYIQPALTYLGATEQGQQILQNLFNNVATVEQELKPPAQDSGKLPAGCRLLRNLNRFFCQSSEISQQEGRHFFWQAS